MSKKRTKLEYEVLKERAVRWYGKGLSLEEIRQHVREPDKGCIFDDNGNPSSSHPVWKSTSSVYDAIKSALQNNTKLTADERREVLQEQINGVKRNMQNLMIPIDYNDPDFNYNDPSYLVKASINLKANGVLLNAAKQEADLHSVNKPVKIAMTDISGEKEASTLSAEELFKRVLAVKQSMMTQINHQENSNSDGINGD